jgi:selenocysteine lyase/cysteine desulfurase
VIFVRNTTEAINVLAAALPAGTRVLSSPVEHHANMLPWRRHELRMLPFPDSADALCAAVAAGIDFVALSGHKLYAPFGAGALIGPVSRLGDGAPLMHGGGAIKLVTLDDVVWADAPERHEAGSPNVVGVVALGAACRALGALGMEAVAEHERTLAGRLRRGLDAVPGLDLLTLWKGDDIDRVGVASFVLAGYRHPLLAVILSAEHAIGVRHGCFCAHPLITRLLGIPDAEVRRLRSVLLSGGTPALPGAVRASLGLGTTEADVDRLTGALDDIARHGPAMRYDHVTEHDEYRPAAVVPMNTR